jgi:antirestriction protein ArdC
MAAGNNRRDLHAEITARIIAAIKEGAPKFEMPWHKAGHDLGVPVNAKSGHRYRGVNILVLWTQAITNAYFTGYWATYRQWQDLGAQVRKGERSSTVLFYKEAERAAENPETGQVETKRVLYARASRVFNADQVDGWQPPADAYLVDLTDPVERVDALVAATEAVIRHGGGRAYYDSAADVIVMPEHQRFVGTKTSSPTEGCYATLLHELVHHSGHPTRLDRDLAPRFRADAYAMEELVAELGAAFLCAELGVSNSPRPDHAAYVASWLTVLKANPRAIVTAAGKASQAVDYLRACAHQLDDRPSADTVDTHITIPPAAGA